MKDIPSNLALVIISALLLGSCSFNHYQDRKSNLEILEKQQEFNVQIIQKSREATQKNDKELVDTIMKNLG